MRLLALAGILVAATLFTAPSLAAAQPDQGGSTPAAPQPPVSPAQPGAIDDTIDAGEADGEVPARRFVHVNEWEGSHFTIRAGGAFLYDYATYAQDAASEQQFEMVPQGKMRDGRFTFGGRLKFLERPTTWSIGYMYDGANDEWVFRQTGIMVDVPEIWGQLFVGRSKEGISLNKVMVGTLGWTMERAAISDATIPILADGVKWLGYAPKAHLIWNFGVYDDALSEGQGFSTYENQVTGRIAWLPVLSTDGGNVAHIGMSARYGKPNNGKLRLRSRPGANPAPYFMDTGEFAANNTKMTEFEAYYRSGGFLIGSEYFFQNVDAPESDNPMFHGGDVVVTWLVTGETRAYNTRGGYFNGISPRRTVYGGGPGAWELVLHANYADMNSGTLTGGKYWRLTPMVNWYLSDEIRLEVAYGYSTMDRFGLTGRTHFFQTRFQFQL